MSPAAQQNGGRSSGEFLHARRAPGVSEKAKGDQTCVLPDTAIVIQQ